MIARDIEAGDQSMDQDGDWYYTVDSVRTMKIDGKPAIAVSVMYHDGGSGVRYFYEDSPTTLIRTGRPSVETELPSDDNG